MLTRIDILYLFLLSTEALNLERSSLSKRSIIFEDFRAESALGGFFIDQVPSITVAGCVLLCLALPNCLSINFCGLQLCQLNSGDIHSVQAFLQEVSTCRYLGMKTDMKTECQEKGVIQTIREGACRTADKVHKVG